ncbi:hypothetical protein RF679_03265 [Undibacterium cyanobacteriorum]|uniref:DUF306 domain-containing protein n=1 Tax=Undibacterium cyanobacteriorum TaxID=3073561 RepID=A0ABY9RM18_9BURK|nr:hypothetical protein [Undibacterium sp. 20NA77.5]WMW81310.1 hypothetical protein RF679_03265 [Undibacterium sp. 20NA77.5]
MIRLLIAITLLALSGCSVNTESQSWHFVQSVGGITVGTPVRVDRDWRLPLNANVSGLKEFTAKPSTMNSGMDCRSVDVSIEGSAIFLTIKSGPAAEARNAQCPPAFLGQLKDGKYDVFYRGANEAPARIGEVSIGL